MLWSDYPSLEIITVGVHTFSTFVHIASDIACPRVTILITWTNPRCGFIKLSRIWLKSPDMIVPHSRSLRIDDVFSNTPSLEYNIYMPTLYNSIQHFKNTTQNAKTYMCMYPILAFHWSNTVVPSYVAILGHW